MKFKVIPNEQTPKCTELINLEEDRKMLEKFWSFARRQHNCAGLASNQCSCKGERIMKPFFAIKVDNRWDIIIEPQILNYIGKKEVMIEGCLTWLGKKIRAERHPTVDVSYTNLKGEKIERQVKGFEAQVWQHEYNHLMGVEEEFYEQ